MKVKETFEQVRHEKKDGFSLQWRLSVAVAVELFVSILIGYGITGILSLFGLHLTNFELILELGIVTLLFGWGFSFLISKWLFMPIKNLRDAMEKVADGDFTVTLDHESSSREISEVYSGFNLMVSELNSTEILQRDFTSNVSHEFKTPIAAIEGYSTLLQGGDNLDEDQREYVEKILYNTKRLSTLVGNILLISKLENQSIETNQQLSRLDEQIRESILALEPAWINKDIEFDVELDSVRYFGNEGLMLHVWDNLISNAVKFSPKGGIVKLRLTTDNRHIIFSIEDNGAGIPEESKKRIFDKFYQLDNSRVQEGHGLGLPLAKRIVALSGGDIRVEDGEQGGARFVVILEK